ncbi:hypothetical protein [Roseibium sp.]|uniref:hypothetical protein n=1 Tax=Roseibium sp. TaxID=1936156 RepID=UPI003A96A8B5
MTTPGPITTELLEAEAERHRTAIRSEIDRMRRRPLQVARGLISARVPGAASPDKISPASPLEIARSHPVALLLAAVSTGLLLGSAVMSLKAKTEPTERKIPT